MAYGTAHYPLKSSTPMPTMHRAIEKHSIRGVTATYQKTHYPSNVAYTPRPSVEPSLADFENDCFLTRNLNRFANATPDDRAR
jgi:hypothetical protein